MNTKKIPTFCSFGTTSTGSNRYHLLERLFIVLQQQILKVTQDQLAEAHNITIRTLRRWLADYQKIVKANYDIYIVSYKRRIANTQ